MLHPFDFFCHDDTTTQFTSQKRRRVYVDEEENVFFSAGFASILHADWIRAYTRIANEWEWRAHVKGLSNTMRNITTFLSAWAEKSMWNVR